MKQTGFARNQKVRRRGREGRGLREEEEEREEEMLFFSFLLLSTSRDLSHLDSEDIIIHHRETKKQRIVLLVRTLNYLPRVNEGPLSIGKVVSEHLKHQGQQ